MKEVTIQVNYATWLYKAIILSVFVVCSEYIDCCVADVQRAIELLDILQESEYFRTCTSPSEFDETGEKLLQARYNHCRCLLACRSHTQVLQAG